MIKTLLHPVFLTCLFLAGVNQFIESQGIFIPLIHSYLDDVLCFPIVLTIGLSIYRIIWSDYVLTPWHIWPLLVVYVFVFELYLPSTSAIYTSDILDVFAYLLGIFVFQKSINKIPAKQLEAIQNT